MDDGSARIELRRKSGPSLWAVVDLEDYERVNRHLWHAVLLRNTTYARGRVHLDPGVLRTSMHRFIMSPGSGLDVDHIDHDGLNNRKSNLRVATRTLNMGNTRSQPGSSSRYKGVHYERTSDRPKRWMAQIARGKKKIHLGRFYTEIDAAIAYDDAARELYGEFALLNFPDDPNGRSAILGDGCAA